MITEATAVEARVRITSKDLGIWKDEHVKDLARIARFLKGQGTVAGIQLAHAGRKASHSLPSEGGSPMSPEQGGWEAVAPSPISFEHQGPLPAQLCPSEIQGIVEAFAAAARRALAAGFELVEIHGAHGYLLNEFLSPLSNRRSDEYGGTLEGRMRFVLEVAEAVRGVWPEGLPVFVRLSVTDWVEGGWTIEESVQLAARLRVLGIDLVDCSSGGNAPDAVIPAVPGYQVPFAERIRREASIPTGAVGLITKPEQADEIIRSGKADLVLLARESLRDPYWPLHAALTLGHRPDVPIQYRRAFPREP